VPKPCDNCNGERELHVDCFDPRRGHYTRPVPCPDCVDDGADDAALDTRLEVRRELAGPIEVLAVAR
jgi:hypothetical protein